MKNFLFALAAGCIPALAATNGAYAQKFNNIVAFQVPQEFITLNNIPEKDNTVNLGAISTKAVKEFKRSYKADGREKWSESLDGFVAMFTLDNVTNRIYYNKKGQWVASVKNYQEDKFNRDVRGIVKSTYYDFDITLVEEIETSETEGIPTFIVHLQDDKSIKLVRVSDGIMDVYKEFNK